MASLTFLSLLVFISAFLPSALARRGGGGGGGGGLGDAISGLKLEPVIAAIFAFCVIFAILTAHQAIQAAKNIHRRSSQQPPSISLPEFTVGPIFPTFLFLSTLTLTIFYVLNGIDWAVTYNEGDSPRLSTAFTIALVVIEYLGDFLLVSSILALLAHREKVLLTNPGSPVFRDIKMIFDAVLCVAILSVSMGEIGVSVAGDTTAEFHAANNLYTARCALFFVAAIDIAVSSIVLYIRARGTHVNDHKIVFLVVCIVSPAAFLWTLYPLILMHITISDEVAFNHGMNLATVIIYCIARFIIIATCLRFGMPPIQKQGKVAQVE